jgi:T5SS/PEP-CTERM-associated repeat protein
VRVLDGGRVTTDGVTLGNLAGSRGQVLVDGADSLWNIDGSLIGSIEDSTITISNGGVIRTSVVPNFSAKTHIRLDGGRLESTSAGNISSSGFLEGSGTIEAGGLNLFGSTSTLYGGPGDHLVVTSFVSVGGHLDLNGGQLVTGTGVQIVVNGNAGLRNGGTLRAGGTGLQIFNGAQFAVTGGQGDIFGAVSNSAGGEIAVVGDSIAVFHDAVTNNGTIFVAPGSQMVTLEDLGFAAGSALSVQLSTVDPDEDAAEGFGQAITSGQTTLAGSLDVSLVGGFQPQLEDTFQIVTAGGGRSGAFATESLPALSGFLGWDVVYSSNAVTLAVVPALLGDYNANGIVDAADYVVWRKTLSQSGIALAADGNRSGTIDSGDYDVWRTQFGQSIVFGSGAAASSAPPFSSTVPEPESALLLVIVVVEMYCRARRLRRQ